MKDAKQLVAAIEPQVKAALVATAYAQAKREQVDAMQRGLLAERVYMVAAEFAEMGRPIERITEPRLSWLMNDADAAEYHAKCKAAHLANGYADAEQGFCPALVAEEQQRQAEHAIIAAAAEFFPGVTVNALLCGRTKSNGQRVGGLESLREYLDLLTGLVVNRPEFEPPSLTS